MHVVQLQTIILSGKRQGNGKKKKDQRNEGSEWTTKGMNARTKERELKEKGKERSRERWNHWSCSKVNFWRWDEGFSPLISIREQHSGRDVIDSPHPDPHQDHNQPPDPPLPRHWSMARIHNQDATRPLWNWNWSLLPRRPKQHCPAPTTSLPLRVAPRYGYQPTFY